MSDVLTCPDCGSKAVDGKCPDDDCPITAELCPECGGKVVEESCSNDACPIDEVRRYDDGTVVTKSERVRHYDAQPDE